MKLPDGEGAAPCTCGATDTSWEESLALRGAARVLGELLLGQHSLWGWGHRFGVSERIGGPEHPQTSMSPLPGSAQLTLSQFAMQRALQVPVPSNETTDAPPPLPGAQSQLGGEWPSDPETISLSQRGTEPGRGGSDSHRGSAGPQGAERQPVREQKPGPPQLPGTWRGSQSRGTPGSFLALQLALLSPPGPGRLHSLTIPGTRMGTPDTPSAGANRLRGGERQLRQPSRPRASSWP